MDGSSRDPWQPLMESMKKLKESWPSRGWSWDGRMNTVSSSFSTEFEAKARASATLALPAQWISSTIGQANPRLRELCAIAATDTMPSLAPSTPALSQLSRAAIPGPCGSLMLGYGVTSAELPTCR